MAKRNKFFSGPVFFPITAHGVGDDSVGVRSPYYSMRRSDPVLTGCNRKRKDFRRYDLQIFDHRARLIKVLFFEDDELIAKLMMLINQRVISGNDCVKSCKNSFELMWCRKWKNLIIREPFFELG